MKFDFDIYEIFMTKSSCKYNASSNIYDGINRNVRISNNIGLGFNFLKPFEKSVLKKTILFLK